MVGGSFCLGDEGGRCVCVCGRIGQAVGPRRAWNNGEDVDGDAGRVSQRLASQAAETR